MQFVLSGQVSNNPYQTYQLYAEVTACACLSVRSILQARNVNEYGYQRHPSGFETS
jgi:hypothetical protein